MAIGTGPANQRKVTVSDVARFAGVSTSVVSYVLNDGPRTVAPDTARRVKEAIARLGYRPNRSARALRTGSTGVLGLIVPDLRNTFFGEFADAVQATARQSGQALLTASSGGEVATEQRLVDELAGRDVDGLVVFTSMGRDDLPGLSHPGLPMALLNCEFPVPGLYTLTPDAAGGAQAAVEHLLDVHGHTGVAFVTGETGRPEPEAREIGWRRALQARGIADGPIIRVPFTREGGHRGAGRLLGLTDRPTAVFVSTDLQSLGLLRAFREAGLDVPGDVAVVSFDGIDESAYYWPPLTSAWQPLAEMARAAVSWVSGREPDDAGGSAAAVEGTAARSPRHQVFGMRLIVRQSCGCPT